MIFGLFKTKKQKREEAFDKALDEAFRNIILGKLQDARELLQKKHGNNTHN